MLVSQSVFLVRLPHDALSFWSFLFFGCLLHFSVSFVFFEVVLASVDLNVLVLCRSRP
jgi:hypothetical protein